MPGRRAVGITPHSPPGNSATTAAWSARWKCPWRWVGVATAQELAEITVTVGLAQNMAALRALATEGIQRGHMALHARNIAIVAGATGEEIDKVAAELAASHDVRTDRAAEILARLRKA
jgi:hydroxymethylglutaryl-CoA reductase